MNMPETFFTVSEELRLFGLSCLLGAVFGAVFDIVRTFRLILRHNDILVAFEDIALLLLYAVALTAFSEAAARSELRLYFVLGSILGFALWYFTAGSVVIKTLRKLFGILGTLLSLILRPVRPIIAFLCKKATANFGGFIQIIVKIFKKTKIVLLNGKHMLYNKMENKKKERESVVEKNET